MLLHAVTTCWALIRRVTISDGDNTLEAFLFSDLAELGTRLFTNRVPCILKVSGCDTVFNYTTRRHVLVLNYVEVMQNRSEVIGHPVPVTGVALQNGVTSSGCAKGGESWLLE